LSRAARTTNTDQRTSGRRAATQKLRTALFREASAIVRAELARPITLTEVSRRVASSPRQVRRAFAEIGGTTFRAFLAEVRMRRAAELLTATDMSVGEVARQVGYREPSRFTKAFKRTYGLTPSRFRETQRRSPSGDWS
jgi:AraC family transcriptional regulator, regulatory protein of adaptative response / methylphosphotriester-DNA alkyltransferase methyltransferase